MSVTMNMSLDALRGVRIRIPQAVVYRAFVQETVVLNLDTGRYHGLNPVGGRMLEAIDKVGLISDAAPMLAAEYARPVAEVEADIYDFCTALIERGLLVADAI